MGFLPICLRAASLPHPFGLFPTNTAVLDAANGSKNTLLRNVSYDNKAEFLGAPPIIT